MTSLADDAADAYFSLVLLAAAGAGSDIARTPEVPSPNMDG
ncbi:MAG: hypothetical protein ACLGRW_17200 [Acidobacteriota bacterium]